MERDEGNLYVLEGVLIALMLLGAAYGVGTLRSSSLDQERPRDSLAKTAEDALVVLAGLDEGNGTLLDVYLREALHCASDAAPSALQCQGTRARNLSLRIDSYLPAGAGWAVGISNGLGMREIYRAPLPGRESVASGMAYGPGWNGTFIATELSCYQAGMDARATLVPLDRAMVARATAANVIAGSLTVAAAPSATAGWWEATLPAATRPASGAALADVDAVNARVPLPGATSYAACDLQDSGNDLVTAVRAITFTADAASVRVGSDVGFTANLASLAPVPGAILVDANVTVYEPVGPRLNESDTWIPSAVLDLDAGGAATWEPDAASFYGTRVVMLRALVDIAGTQVEARRITTIQVALPTGEVPIDAPYRIVLHAWMADWG